MSAETGRMGAAEGPAHLGPVAPCVAPIIIMPRTSSAPAIRTIGGQVPLGTGLPGAGLQGVNARLGTVRPWLMEAGGLPYLVGYAPLRAGEWLRNGGRSSTGAAADEANTTRRGASAQPFLGLKV